MYAEGFAHNDKSIENYSKRLSLSSTERVTLIQFIVLVLGHAILLFQITHVSLSSSQLFLAK